jgi:FSR family fosmidomycin resistance protein-like MFS transporter
LSVSVRLAQSLFQVGGNIGSAFGPLTAAIIVGTYGQKSIFWYSLLALLAIFILFNVGLWYRKHGAVRLKAAHASHVSHDLPRNQVMLIVTILLLLVFVQMFYSASLSSYFTFYLIEKFHLSVQSAQLHLFAYLFAIAVGTMAGGLLGDRVGRKRVILFSILGPLPFTLALPFAGLLWTGIFSLVIGVIMASAFPTIVVYGQDLIPGKTGTISGMFFGFSFGIGGIGAAALGKLADWTSIDFVYHVVAFLPFLGLLAFFLPDVGHRKR